MTSLRFSFDQLTPREKLNFGNTIATHWVEVTANLDIESDVIKQHLSSGFTPFDASQKLVAILAERTVSFSKLRGALERCNVQFIVKKFDS